MVRPAPPAPALAVVGIFSHDGNIAYRKEIRQTWMHTGEANRVFCRFVLRGNGSLSRDEALREGDIVLLEELTAASPRRTGPLSMLLPWMRYALNTWPAATLVGKADDDVWVDLPGVARHLRDVQQQLWDSHRIAQFTWGSMESFHFSLNASGPVGFSYNRWRDCAFAFHGWPPSGGKSALLGPFPFPKGPLFFLTRGLAALVIGQPALDRYVSHIIRHTSESKFTPWEDVFLGAALSAMPIVTPAAHVHIGVHGVYSEGWNFNVFNTSLIYHQKTKVPSRIGIVHKGLSRSAPRSAMSLTCNTRPYISCTKSLWTPCAASRPSSVSILDFKRHPPLLALAGV